MKNYLFTICLCASLVLAALWQLRPGSALYQKLPFFSEKPAAEQAAQRAENETSEESAADLTQSAGDENGSTDDTQPDGAANTTAANTETPTGADAQADASQQSTETSPANPSDASPKTGPVPAASEPDASSAADDAVNPDSSVPLPPAQFADTLFIGDSRTVGLSEYGNLGEATVFADTGLTVFKLFQDQVKVKGFGQTNLEAVLKGKQYQFIYLMLGINEIGYPEAQLTKKYHSVVETIRSLQPNAKLVLSANLHVTAEKSAASSVYNNERINALNAAIKTMAAELSCSYIDPNVLFDDENGNLAKEYSSDGSHPLGKYYARWSQWLQDGATNRS